MGVKVAQTYFGDHNCYFCVFCISKSISSSGEPTVTGVFWMKKKVNTHTISPAHSLITLLLCVWVPVREFLFSAISAVMTRNLNCLVLPMGSCVITDTLSTDTQTDRQTDRQTHMGAPDQNPQTPYLRFHFAPTTQTNGAPPTSWSKVCRIPVLGWLAPACGGARPSFLMFFSFFNVFLKYFFFLEEDFFFGEPQISISFPHQTRAEEVTFTYLC